MQRWIVMSCVLAATFLASRADPVSINASPEDRSPQPNPAAVFNGSEPVRERAVQLLEDRMKQGDAVLRERLKESIGNLKELLQEEDVHLNERISGGLARLKVQDNELKEEQAEDVARLKEKLAKGLSYLKEELEEGEGKTKEELTKLKEALEKRQQDVKQANDSAKMDDLRQQMTDLQTELISIKHQLQATQENLQTTEVRLQSSQETLQSAQEKARSSVEALREQLYEEQQVSAALNAQLQTAEQEIRSLKVEMDSVQSNHDLLSSEIGSTFIRWGRTTCPDNTALVYSGYVGGQRYHHSGGGSNYLCLVKDPDLDTMALPARYNYLYGAEYQDIGDQMDQDPVCSVCRAPQTTTLMIPATLSCPTGWTAQYGGHLVSTHFDGSGRSDYVCLDKDREHRQGGQAPNVGAEFFHVVTQCGSLPCPPYVKDRVVTCVVCSK